MCVCGVFVCVRVCECHFEGGGGGVHTHVCVFDLLLETLKFTWFKYLHLGKCNFWNERLIGRLQFLSQPFRYLHACVVCT